MLTGNVTLASRHSDGTPGNGTSGNRIWEWTEGAISGDGRFVAFASEASNLVDNDNNEQVDVFVHDRVLGTTEVVNLNSQGQLVADPRFDGLNFVGISAHMPRISDDGNLVFFQSLPDLVPEDTNREGDVYVRNRQAGTTSLVSTTESGAMGNRDSALRPAIPMEISSDGRFVAFSSRSTNFVPNTPTGNQALNLFVKDRATGRIELITRRPDGSPDQSSLIGDPPLVSGDGRFLYFTGDPTAFVEGGVSAGVQNMIRVFNQLFSFL